MSALTDFNPIIGLILTQLTYEGEPVAIRFQSHYRSDFNLISDCNNIISIFQSHYRSDFNQKMPVA